MPDAHGRSDLGQGVGKPETNDPTKLQEQIDILIHDQRKHDPGLNV